MYRRNRAFVMLGLAVLLAGGSVYMARNWIQDQTQSPAPVQNVKQIETTKVIVAASKLHYGTKIQNMHLRVVDWPVEAVPEGSFSTVEDILGEGDQPASRVVLRTIETNEPVLKTKVTGFGGRASLSTLIAPGMRATTIRVNDVNGVAGLVLPGDRVDILLTRSRDVNAGKRNRSNLQTDIFLQNMKVLAIDQDSNEERNKPGVVKAVTIEVTPVQAQKLTLAQKLGSLSLALRNVNSVDAEDTSPVKAHDLGFGEANLSPTPVIEASKPAETVKAPIVTKPVKTVSHSVVVKKAKRAYTVNIVRGVKATEYEVEQEKPTFSAPALSKPLNLIAPTLTILTPTKPSLGMVSLVPCSSEFTSNEDCM